MTKKSSHLILHIVQTAVFLFVVSAFSHFSFAAQDNPEADRLIHAYVSAVQSNDLALVKSAWNDLNNDTDSVNYMRENMPQLYYLFQVRGLYFQMQTIQDQRPESFTDNQGIAATVEGASETLKNALSPGEVEAAKFSVSAPDINRTRTNGDIAAEAQGTPKIDNQLIALGNPNQNRINNKDFVQNRVRSLYEQKFQQPPEELAPRGDVLTKTKLPADPDVRIKGLFTDITLKKSSAEEQYVKVYINDHLIVSDLKISRTAEYLRIYLESGTNILKISPDGQNVSNPIKNSFVTISFKKTQQGEQKFSLNLPEGAVQTLRIEASP